METTKIQKIFIGGGLVLVILGGFYFLNKNNSKNNNMNNSQVSTTTDSGIVLDSGNDGQYTITQVPIEERKPIPVPDLDRKIIFGSSVSLTEEVRKIVTDKILALQAELKKDKNNLNNWISLGLYQKMAGDYAGAVMSWKYVGEVADKDFVSFGNLGDLYGYYLRDNGMAEMYYKKAISNAPTQSYLYVQLAMLYKDVFKDMDKARAIIESGLKVIPSDQSLIETKNNLI